MNASNATADTIALNGGTGVVVSTDKLTVSGFAVANDIVCLDSDQTTAANASVVIQAVNAVPTGALTFATATSEVLALNFDLGGATNVVGTDLTGAAILSNLNGQTLSVSATADKGYIVAYDAGNAYLYQVTEGDDVDALVAAADIALIGVFNGVAVGGFNVANFTQAA